MSFEIFELNVEMINHISFFQDVPSAKCITDALCQIAIMVMSIESWCMQQQKLDKKLLDPVIYMTVVGVSSCKETYETSLISY